MLLFLIIGSLVGFFSGLLGIGGGILLVPSLKYYFEIQQHISANMSMHMAVATSLAVIIFTSSRTAWYYYKKNNIDISLFHQFLPGILIGAVIGILLSKFLNGTIYVSLFALLLLYNASQLLIKKNKSTQDTTSPLHQKKLNLYAMSLFIGSTSSLLGVGGAVMMTPYFIKLGLDIRKAIGTSILSSIPIALLSTVVHTLFSNKAFIQWPLVFIISLTSMFFSPIGAAIAHKLNQIILQKIFALFLILIAARMVLF